MPLVDPQNVVAIDHNRELQQRGQEPQIQIAYHGPTQHAVAADCVDLLAKIAEWMAVELARWICRGYARNAKTCRQAKQRAAQQSDAGLLLVSAKIKSQKSTGNRRRDGRQERAQFDHAIAPGKVLLRQ